MLVRSGGASLLTLVCLVLSSAAVSAGGDAELKLHRAKQADRDGYVAAPLAGRAAQFAETEPNDTAETAESVAVGDVVDAAVPNGDVDWFVLDTAGFVTISTGEIGGTITDTVLDVFAADATTLVASDDDGGASLFSAVTSLEVAGPVYVRVSRFSALGDDGYQLFVESADAPPVAPANDAPASAVVLESCNGAVEGTTVGATNAIGVASCVSPDPLGSDVFYRVDLDFSFQLTVQVDPEASFDPAIIIFTDPADPAGSCIAAADVSYAGEGELLSYTNENPDEITETLYVGIDSWDPERSGSFTGIFSCDFVVDNDNTSFGALKARF